MFKTIITGIFEITGKIVGEAAHQTGQIAEAITEIPDAFTRGYEAELFDKNKAEEVATTTTTQSTVNVTQPTQPTQQTQTNDE